MILRKENPVRKHISIQNFKGHPKIDESYVEESIRTLENGVYCIINDRPLELPLEELYQIVQNLLQLDKRDCIFLGLHTILESHLSHKLEFLESLENGIILPELNKLWEDFCRQVMIIKNIYLCYDRCPKNCNIYNSVQSACMNLFKTMIVLSPTVRKKYTEEINVMIEAERNGEKINCKLLKIILVMLTELQVYDEVFQTEFVRNSEAFYRNEGQILEKYDTEVCYYLKRIERRIFEEHERCESYLNKRSRSQVMCVLYRRMINDQLSNIFDKGFRFMLEKENFEHLTILYMLVKMVSPGIKTLATYFQDYIMKEGMDIVNKPDNEKTMIQELLDFKDKLDFIVEDCFDKNEVFSEIMRTSFSKFINSKQNKPAQYLAKYVDAKLRSKDICEEKLETILNKVMVLFRFVQGKDVFEAFYKKDLAKRLLLGKSTSQDAEDSMVAKLKQECGAEFTSKIEGMFKDVHVSRGVSAAFRRHLANLRVGPFAPAPVDLCISVLTSGCWPSYAPYEVVLPPELASYQDLFQKFYSINHSGRKLFWQPSLGHCVVKASFETSNKELQVSLFQAIILLLFNTTDTLTFSEIQEFTNLECEELKRTLLSLSCCKCRVLLRKPKNKTVNPEDTFSFNKDFTDKLFRVRINQLQLKETVEEQKATENSVLIDRQFQIDAAIVRILKKKKTINHNELISELFNMLDIPVKPQDLKKRIELLIDREYMERDKNNPSNYTYVA